MKALIDTQNKTIELKESVSFDELKKFIKEYKLEGYTIVPSWNYYPAYPYPIYSTTDKWVITSGYADTGELTTTNQVVPFTYTNN